MRTVKSIKPLDNDGRYALRRAGILTLTEVNGKVFIPPGGGIPTDGTSGAARQWADKILGTIEMFTCEFEENPEKIKKIIEDNGYKITKDLRFKLIINNGHLGVLEENIPVFMPFGLYWPKLVT